MTLLHRPRPIPDESPKSLLLRAAEWNQWPDPIHLVSWALQSGGLGVKQYVALLCRPPEMEVLTSRLGFSEGTGRAVAYARPGWTEASPVLWEGLPVPTRSLRLSFDAVCPECLEERRYLRRLWDHRLITACPRHHVLLIDRCPVCRAPLGVRRRAVTFCPNHHSLLRARTEPVDDAPTAEIMARIAAGNGHAVEVLDGLVDALNRCLGDAETMAECHHRVELALEMAQRDGVPGELIQACGAQLSEWHPRVLCLPWLESPLAEHQDLGQALVQRLSEEVVPSAPGAGEPRQSPRAATPPASLTVTQSGVALGINPRYVGAVCDGGLLVATARRRGGVRRVQTQSVSTLLRRLKRPDALGQPDPPGSMPLARYLTNAARHPSLAEALRAVCEGDLEGRGFDPVQGVMTLSVVAPPAATVESDTLSLKEAARRCDVHPENVRFAIKAGWIEAATDDPANPASRRRRRYRIEKPVLERFRTEYVFSGALARELGVAVTTLAAKLNFLGITAVSGPHLDGGLTCLYRRRDVEAVHREKLLGLERYDTPAGRKPKSSPADRPTGLSVPEAAAALNSDAGRILTLVHRKVLAKVAGVGRNLRIDEASLDQFRQSLNDPDRIGLEEAAAAVNETRAEFERRWVRTGFVHAEARGLTRAIDRADLQRIQALKAKYVTAAEAARLLGHPRWLVPNWEKRREVTARLRLGQGGNSVKFYLRREILAFAERRTRAREGPSGH